MRKIRHLTTRRGFLATGAASVAAPAILRATRAYAQNPTLRVGHVSPRTGPLAGFAEADDFVLSQVQEISPPVWKTTARHGRSRSSRRTASRTRTGPQRWPPT